MPSKPASKKKWTVADFEMLLHELPSLDSPGADQADLVVVDALVGPDFCVVLTCPRLFRLLERIARSFSEFATLGGGMFFGRGVCSRVGLLAADTKLFRSGHTLERMSNALMKCCSDGCHRLSSENFAILSLGALLKDSCRNKPQYGTDNAGFPTSFFELLLAIGHNESAATYGFLLGAFKKACSTLCKMDVSGSVAQVHSDQHLGLQSDAKSLELSVLDISCYKCCDCSFMCH